MNTKEIIRDKRFEIILSKEEKDLFEKYAEKMGLNKSRLARNILMEKAESYLAPIEIGVVRAYIKYLEITKDKEMLERIKKD